LARFFGVHVWMLPVALLALVGLHLYLVVRIGISAAPRRQE
jgi:ubiquinol-cytochrome c reductase cytochrome b subunit